MVAAGKTHPDALVGRGEGKSDVGEALVLTAKGPVENSWQDSDVGGEADVVWLETRCEMWWLWEKYPGWTHWSLARGG